jgi:acetyl-CoA carboxylase carboxyl transferase subunit beta
MTFKDMFKKTTYISVEPEKAKGKNAQEAEPNVPEGMWKKCGSCGEMVYSDDLEENFYVCPKCGYHLRIGARKRLELVLDPDTFTEWDTGLENGDPLEFDGYEEKITELKLMTGLDEAVITGTGKIGRRDVVIGVCDTSFLMGSMGHVVGEKITRAVERATKQKKPVILFTCSGGARMQEGIVSLMQMAKTSAALKKHSEAGLLYVSVLTDPTTGGVTASFAMLGDIILAEPGALVGFAGPRVIKQTIGQELPEGFQRSEFLLEHGLIDNVVQRPNLKRILSRILRLHTKPKQVPELYAKITDELEEYRSKMLWELSEEASMPKKKEEGVLPQENTTDDNDKNEDEKSIDDHVLTAWDRVQISRMPERPTAVDYMKRLFTHFYELHGDRSFRDDRAIVGGIAMFGHQPVTVIGQQKGHNTKENILRNFGMPYPEGYRKALRLMKQAEKFKRPIICFVDTPGAFCGIEAEERGQGEAIARNLAEMSSIKVPILTIMIGEGGSGGALAMAVANEVWMMENATYTILSPEGFASILWKDSKRSSEAAEVMKVTASDLRRLGIIEIIIPEREPATQENIEEISMNMKEKILSFLQNYMTKKEDDIVEDRYHRFRNI